MICLLAGCKAAPLSEKKIQEQLPKEVTSIQVDGEEVPLEIDKMTVEKRKTEKDTDDVYCSLQLKNDCYVCTKEIVLHYSLYNKGGWILDQWSPEKPTQCEVTANPLSEEKMAARIQETTKSPNEVKIEDVKFSPGAETGDAASAQYTCIGETEYSNLAVKDTINITYTFANVENDEFTWQASEPEKTSDRKWQLTGTWAMNEQQKGNAFEMNIESFDQASMTATGTCHYEYEGNTADFDLANATIELDSDDLWIVFSESTGFMGVKSLETGIIIKVDSAKAYYNFYYTHSAWDIAKTGA